MSKQRTTISLDEDIAEHITADHINTSGLVNDLLRDYLSGEDGPGIHTELIRHQIRQLEDEAVDLEQRAERKREQADALRERLAALNEQKEVDITDHLEDLGQLPSDPSHPEFQRLADRHDMDPQAVAETHAEIHGKDVVGDA